VRLLSAEFRLRLRIADQYTPSGLDLSPSELAVFSIGQAKDFFAAVTNLAQAADAAQPGF
jgi:hypothetical protein